MRRLGGTPPSPGDYRWEVPPRPEEPLQPGPGARSLADDIRARTDAQLARLVLGRPDLARPAPADLTSLAARAGTMASVQRAVEALDRGHLHVLEALVVAGDEGGVAALLDTDCDLSSHLCRLWDLALLWRAADGLRVVRAVPEVLGPHPAGLGPAYAELRGEASRDVPRGTELERLLAAAPTPARAVLDRLAWGPPVGVVGGAGTGSTGATGAGATGAGATGAGWLLERHLIVAVSGDRVVLPREVGLALRGGRLHRETALTAPGLVTTAVGCAAADAASGGQVSDLLVLVEEVAARWGPEPPRVLRAGGIAVRDLKRLAGHLDLAPDRTAWLLELAHAAGILGDDGEIVPVWALTAAYDEWLLQDAGARWARLATAWLASTRSAHLVGGRTAGGASPANALGPDVHWPPIRAIRAEVLDELASLATADAPTADSVVARLHWRRPLRNPALLRQAAYAVLREAEWLGVTGRGALSRAGRALTAGSSAEDLAGLISAHLPPSVDHILLQADLTAVAPGPLDAGLARFMRLSADVESRGGATVYRFSRDSVRRALDTGWTADEVLDTLRRSSRTPVPQPMEYLVRDVARRHGQTRVGGAASYIRSDDEAVLEAMVADRSLTALQLRRVAPTIVVCGSPPLVLLEALRDNGYAPVHEGPDGSVIVVVPGQRRSTGRRVVPAPPVATVDEAFTTSLVKGLRAGEESADFLRAQQDSSPSPRLLPTDPTVTLAVLRDAAADRHGVWIGYADGSGRTTRRLFHPTRVEGGRAIGTVADGAEERSFSIHRITGVAST